MSGLRRRIFTGSWRANNRARAQVSGRVLRPITSTLASVSLVLGALAGSVVASSPATAAGAVPSCAAGGPCVLGDTGPGGGLVFLISGGKTYEMAKKTWSGGIADPSYVWCNVANTSVPGSAARGINIGTGAANTAAIAAFCTSGAGKTVASLVLDGFDDWFLPSKDELTAMCNYSRTWVGSPSTATCAGSQNADFALSAYGFDSANFTDYWSSSERYKEQAWAQRVSTTAFQFSSGKNGEERARPVRAFTAPVFPQTVTWPADTSITTTTPAPSTPATTDGNGTISYAVTSAGTTGCTVNSSTAALTFTGAGSCQITASASETTSFTANSTAVTFTVALTPQTLTVSAGTTTPEVFSSTDLSTTGVVGTGAVTYNVASGTSSCSVANSTLTGSAAGSCTVTSSVAADSMYASAISSAITITVQVAAQSVTWAPTNTSLSFSSSPVTPSSGASTSGDGAITYSVTSGSCSVNESSGTLTYSAAGTCVVRATAAASPDYSAGTRDVTFTIAADRPTAPTITSVSPGSVSPDNGTATVAFSVPSSNGGATITGYTATASNGASGSCASSPCTITGLTIGTPYTITVTATNSAGTGVASLASPPVTPATSTGSVETLSVLPGDGTLVVSWVAPACLAANTCGIFVDYKVFTKTSGDSYLLKDTITSVGTVSSTITGLVNGTQYDVKVTVTTSTPSSSADAEAKQVPATVPSAPTNVTVSRLTATTVSVGWSAPSSNGGQPIDDYTVTATSSNGGGTVTATPPSTSGFLTLDIDKTYTITVQARNLMGLGTLSSASSAVTMGLVAQSITVVPEATTMTADSKILLSSSGSSGTGAKSFAVVPADTCSVSGAALTATAAGTCVVTATIAADALNAAATSAGVSVTVTPAIQTVSWSPTTVFTVTNSPVTLASATASAGGALAYSVTSAGTAGCSFTSGSTLAFTAPGSCTVQVVAGATSTHAASSPVSLTITVGLATRSITWSPTTTLVAADSGSAASSLATISTGSGSPTYTVSSAGISGCTVNASSAVISFTAPGTCEITVTAPANVLYSVTSTFVTFTITSAPQTVSWSPSTSLTLSQSPLEMDSANGSGGGTITYAVTSQGTSDCTIESITGILSFTTPGQCLVTATAGSVTGYTAGSTAVTFLLSKNSTVVPGPAPSSGGSSAPVIADNSVDPGAAVSVPGNSSLFIGSSSVPMTVSANSANTGLDMSMGQWEVTIAPAVAATALPLGPQGELRTTQGQTLDISGTSYLRGTTVNIFIMSKPILIGATRVSARGNFSTTVTIPPTMSLGIHTLQIVGVNPGNETSRASLGITVVATDSTVAVVKSPIGTQVGFIKNTAKLTQRGATALISLVGQIPAGSTDVRARVLMYVPKSAGKQEVKLNNKRKTTVVSALRAAGYSSEITTKVIKKKSKKGTKKGAQGNAITIWFNAPITDQSTV